MTTLPPITNSMPSLADAGGAGLPGASPLDTAAATTYTDINGLAALKRDPSSPQAISAVAEQVEALFLQMMLKSMRDATAALETDSNEMGMYQDMFDKQVALSISQHADLGIGRLLKRQLAGKTAPGAAPTIEPGSDAHPGGAPRRGHRALAGGIRRSIDAADSSRRERPGGDPDGHAGAGGTRDRLGPAHAAHRRRLVEPQYVRHQSRRRWTGARATADSMEVSNGVATLTRTTFRAYGFDRGKRQ